MPLVSKPFDNEEKLTAPRSKKKKHSVDTRMSPLIAGPSTSTLAQPGSPMKSPHVQSNASVGQGLKLNFALPSGPDLNKAKIKDDEHSLYLGAKQSSQTPNSMKRHNDFPEADDQLAEYENNIKTEREKYAAQAKKRSDAISKRKQLNKTTDV